MSANLKTYTVGDFLCEDKVSLQYPELVSRFVLSVVDIEQCREKFFVASQMTLELKGSKNDIVSAIQSIVESRAIEGYTVEPQQAQRLDFESGSFHHGKLYATTSVEHDVCSVEFAQSQYNLFERSNAFIDHYLRKLVQPSRYKKMQKLYDMYVDGDIKIKDERTFKRAYNKVSLKVHPDKNQGATDELFKKASDLSKSSNEIYEPIRYGLYKANVVIKVADTFTDVARVSIDPTQKNIVKAGADIIQCVALCKANPLMLYGVTAVEVGYQLYNESYEEAIWSITTVAGFAILSAAVYTSYPAISVVLGATLTAYSVYRASTNAYDLYNEWQDVDDNEQAPHSYDKNADTCLVGNISHSEEVEELFVN